MHTENVHRTGQKKSLADKLSPWRVLAGLAILTWVSTACQPAPAYISDESWWFADTGHTVRGEFLSSFLSMGGDAALGSPITEPFQQDGRAVQCFEFACLENHPDNPQGPTVKLSQLGERLGRRQPALTSRDIPPIFNQRGRYFAPMGHAVRGDFLDYFEVHDGLETLGFPIAEPMVVNGQMVQDFQLSRLIWSSERESGFAVKREPIGETWILRQSPDLLSPVPRPSEAVVVP